MTDATAMGLSGVSAAAATVLPYKFPYGTTWVFGGAASLDFAKGSVTLFTPPAGSSTSPVSMVGVSATANGYTKKTDSSALLTGGNNNTSMTMNAKLFAPTTTVVVFSTNNTYAAVAGGVVAFRIDLKASASGSGGLVITAPGGFSNPPPPYRTVKVVTTDSSGGTPATNSAVATISNFSPYTVHVLSWRTG
jgi:hypothetical protein